MKRITQFILCIVLAVSAYGQGVGGNSVPRTVSGISAALDLISSTQGTVFYRGASGWEALPPGTSGQLFSTQGAAANPIWVTATGGAGDVNGPTLGTATDNAIVRFDGTGGKTVQNSAVTIADTTGSISINGTDTATAVNTGGFKSANFGLSTVSGGASYFGGAVMAQGDVSLTCTGGAREVRITTTTSGAAGFYAQGYSSATTVTGTAGGELVLHNQDATVNTFGAVTNLDAAGNTTSRIRFINESDPNNTGSIAFSTRPSGGSLTDALTIASTGAATFAGAVTSNGNLTVSGAATGAGVVAVRNTATGVADFGRIQLGNNTSATLLDVYAFSSGYSAGVWEKQNGIALLATGAGGMSLGTSNASGDLRIFAAGVAAPQITVTGTSATFAGAVTHTLGTNYPPQTAPDRPASGWVLYTDSGDGNKLKAKASTGTVVTIGTL